MDDERGHEEEEQPRKIRVVDKRISARRSQDGDASSASEPVTDQDSAEAEATVTPLRPPPAGRSDHPSESAAPAGDSAPAPPQPAPGNEPQGQGVWTPEQEEEARRMAEEMARIPSVEWVINVAVTLANAAGTKLNEGLRDDASLAIDALSAIVEKVGPRLGEAEAPLKQTLAQLQMAFAQMPNTPEAPT
jgi:hypothetical protein